MYTLFNNLKHYFLFFGWRDCIEIIFFTTLIYLFSLWLSKDTKKNLLIPFYSYGLLFFSSSMLQLPTITFFLLLAFPASILIFISLHQITLQRNFITAKNIPSSISSENDWIELLLRVCMQTFNKNQPLKIIIEKSDHIDEYLQVPFKINCPFNMEFLTMFMESKSFNPAQFIWLDSTGLLLGINASYNNPYCLTVDENNNREEYAILALSHKTDALIIITNPTSRNFTLHIKTEQFEHLTVTSTIRIIKKYIHTMKPQKELLHVNIPKNNNQSLSA